MLFYEVVDRESTDPSKSNNGGDYFYGRTIAVEDGVPVAVYYWTSAEFAYCSHRGQFGECLPTCGKTLALEFEVKDWQSGKLMEGAPANKYMLWYHNGDFAPLK